MSAPTTAEVREALAKAERDDARASRSYSGGGDTAPGYELALEVAERRDALAAEVARLREVIATKYAIERSSLSVSALVEERGTIALAAGLGADASAEEVAARVGEMARTLSLLGTWRHEYGAALKPSGADTYGEGMRAAKGQVGAILSRLAEDAGRG